MEALDVEYTIMYDRYKDWMVMCFRKTLVFTLTTVKNDAVSKCVPDILTHTPMPAISMHLPDWPRS